ncbi:hypothetical protein, partial [Escherichia coli]|uniref:hypothetical protein n=1 Tax=Escherichia coli TaxID=562 RepID=UPI002577041D
LMMNPVPWLQMTNMISYQGLVRTFPSANHRISSKSMQYSAENLYLSAKNGRCVFSKSGR